MKHKLEVTWESDTMITEGDTISYNLDLSEEYLGEVRREVGRIVRDLIDVRGKNFDIFISSTK